MNPTVKIPQAILDLENKSSAIQKQITLLTKEKSAIDESLSLTIVDYIIEEKILQDYNWSLCVDAGENIYLYASYKENCRYSEGDYPTTILARLTERDDDCYFYLGNSSKVKKKGMLDSVTWDCELHWHDGELSINVKDRDNLFRILDALELQIDLSPIKKNLDYHIKMIREHTEKLQREKDMLEKYSPIQKSPF